MMVARIGVASRTHYLQVHAPWADYGVSMCRPVWAGHAVVISGGGGTVTCVGCRRYAAFAKAVKTAVLEKEKAPAGA